MGSQLDPLPLSKVGSRERASKSQLPQLDFVKPPSWFHPVTWERVIRQDVLQLLKKGKNSQRGMDLWILALIFPSSFSFTFCPVPRIPTKRFLAPTPILWSTHWITQVSSSQTPTNADFYMLLILQLRPPLSIIFLQHQPLISPGSKQNTELAII